MITTRCAPCAGWLAGLCLSILRPRARIRLRLYRTDGQTDRRAGDDPVAPAVHISLSSALVVRPSDSPVCDAVSSLCIRLAAPSVDSFPMRSSRRRRLASVAGDVEVKQMARQAINCFVMRSCLHQRRPVRRTTARWPHTARRTALLRLRRYIARDDDINHELLLSPTHSQTGNLLPRLLPLAWGFTVRLWTWLRSRRVFHEDRDGVIRVRNY